MIVQEATRHCEQQQTWHQLQGARRADALSLVGLTPVRSDYRQGGHSLLTTTCLIMVP